MDKYKFYASFKVRFAETDLQGHVFFGHYLTYFDEALTEYMRAIGCTYHDLLAEGADLFYISAHCDYKSRAFFEEILHVHARIGKIGNSSITYEFAAYEEKTDRLIATGNIIAVTVDRETQKPTRVPQRLREAVMRYEGMLET